MYKVESEELEDGLTKIIITDDSGTRDYQDGGEPEDNYFFRDWSWVFDELDSAYQQGVKDGQQNTGVQD